ncbi:MAG: hypothetical protein Q9M41_00190 [Paracoccaceae bacterium]|nr:hypothetical protein [Paracoccaceae bacterium]
MACAAIRSHVSLVDQVIAVHSTDNDAIPAALSDLRQELGARLQVVSAPRGEDDLWAYGVSQAPGAVVVGFHDDQIAFPTLFRRCRVDLDAVALQAGRVFGLAVLNLAHDHKGKLGISSKFPITHGGALGFFAPDTQETGRIFAGFAGFRLLTGHLGADRPRHVMDLAEARAAMAPGPVARLSALFGAGRRFELECQTAVAPTFPDDHLTDALGRLAPGWRDVPGIGGQGDV